MFVDTSMERKVSFPTQLAAIGTLLNLLPLSLRDIIGQYEELALDTTQPIHAKLIREWFSKLTKQQQSLSLNLFWQINFQKSDVSQYKAFNLWYLWRGLVTFVLDACSLDLYLGEVIAITGFCGFRKLKLCMKIQISAWGSTSTLWYPEVEFKWESRVNLGINFALKVMSASHLFLTCELKLAAVSSNLAWRHLT